MVTLWPSEEGSSHHKKNSAQTCELVNKFVLNLKGEIAW